MTDLAFSTLDLAPAWLANLGQLGFTAMTPIQALALPPMLAGRDVLGQAGTGTGKTVAFGLAVMAKTQPRSGRPGALVLCPTRELAAQVADELRRLARPLPHTRVVTLSGGTSVQRERGQLEHGVDVIVGTPGRVLDHLQRGRLDLGAIRVLVLDEADRMLEMGFVDAVTAITAATPPRRQTLLMSATFPDAVRALSASFQRDALEVIAPPVAVAPVTHVLYDLGEVDRAAALVRVLGHHQPASAIVFCNHRETCDHLAAALRAAGVGAVALHGGMDQHDRNTVLLVLNNGSLRVVVATDVAARGLDVDELGAVVNVDLPWEADVFVHRTGRTGRAGHQGLAITLTDRRDRGALDALRAGPLAAVEAQPLPPATTAPLPPAPMTTVAIQGGRHDKLRPGDIVGALTTEVGIAAADIGPIRITDHLSFVAVATALGPQVVAGINRGKIKNRRFRAYPVVVPGQATRPSPPR
ncbi:MAG: ATP-dependent RNA helicase DbpA [Kofleriaceae bacterium]